MEKKTGAVARDSRVSDAVGSSPTLAQLDLDLMVAASLPVALEVRKAMPAMPMVIALSLVNRKLIVEFAAKHHMPAIYQAPLFAEAGGLVGVARCNAISKSAARAIGLSLPADLLAHADRILE
ncbi:MAG TPA: hypothetical protein VMS98_16205 [Thermoanaerobaculia bacterium]|nr:hypothetical protein [Thermoanaerobaculia bacterium]